MTPFSPMALNNLNNPYSPQPATPLGSTSGEEVFNLNNTYIVDNSVNVVTTLEDGHGHNHQVVMGGAPSDDRSRHSSAESDPNLVKSAPMSPHHGGVGVHGAGGHQHGGSQSYVAEFNVGGQRLRHQSAGNQPNPAFATLKPPDWMHQENNVLQNFVTNSEELQEAMLDQSNRPQSVPICEMASVVVSTGMDFLPASILETDRNKTVSGQDLVMCSASELTNHSTSTSSNANPAGGGNPNAGGPGGGGGANDDLDLTLSALKDCDKDFKKFVQEVENNGSK